MTKEFPSYKEILELEEELAQEIFLKRHTVDFMSLFLEMVEHEEETGSFEKTASGEITPAQQLLLDVFNRDKAMEVVELFRKVDIAFEIADEAPLI